MQLIPLTKHYYTTVDDDTYLYLVKFNWFYMKGYACRTGCPGTQIFMHHDIIGVPPQGLVVDHIDRDRLNNQRLNLRFTTTSGNAQNKKLVSNNTSGYRGVYLNPTAGKWMAQIKKDGKKIHLGYFKELEDAARAYDKAALELFGEHAAVNFPLDSTK